MRLELLAPRGDHAFDGTVLEVETLPPYYLTAEARYDETVPPYGALAHPDQMYPTRTRRWLPTGRYNFNTGAWLYALDPEDWT